MEYNEDCFSKVIPLLKDFLYHLASYRVIRSTLNKFPGEREFWVYTCDAHLKNAALVWCMVFGTDFNETHWKNIFKGYNENANELFRKYLQDNSNIKKDDFQKYWESMKTFRNDYVAHKAGYDKPVPVFDVACTIVFCFDSWLRKMISPDSIDMPSFMQLFNEYQRDIKNTMQKIYNSMN